MAGRVSAGGILATDPACFSVPLLAPYGGTARLDEAEGHIVLDGLEAPTDDPTDDPRDDQAADPANDVGRNAPESRPGAAGRRELVRLGAWQFVSDARTGLPADPEATPSAVIVSTIHLEPFLARGDVQLAGRLSEFARGLTHIQSFLEYEPIYLVVPAIHAPLVRKIRESVRGTAWIELVSVPLRYPFDHFGILARHLGLKADPERPVWALPVAGVFAFDRALTQARPALERIISLGGPAVDDPAHFRGVVGYPIDEIVDDRLRRAPARILRGGALTGSPVGSDDLGLDAECSGLTVLAEAADRQFLAFARPGWSRHSYGRTFLSRYCPGPPERLRTALRGELRPCVACGQCVDVCAAGIMPNAIHKYLYGDDIEAAQRLRVDLCVECGLCSYVCPSKIELRQQFLDAKRAIREELTVEEVPA